MILEVENNFTSSRFIFNKKQKDYDIFGKNDIEVFVYGYPIDFHSKAWTSPSNIYDEYIKDKWHFIENIDGVYSIIILDKTKKQVFVITDRIGIYTMFYYKNNNYFIITDNIMEIKHYISNIKLNNTSIIEFLNLGFKIGNKTLIEEVFEFEPATKYKINQSLTITEEKYWSLFEKEIKDKITIEDFRNLFNSNLNTVSGLEKNIILPISGGRDTRTILSAINDKKKLLCYTFGPHDHSDVLESKKICDHLKIDHSFIEIDDNWAKQIDFSNDLINMNCNGLGPFFYNLPVKVSLERLQNKAELALQGELGNQLWRHHPFGNIIPNSMDLDSNSLFMIKNIPRVLYFKSNLKVFYEKLYRDYTIQGIAEILKTSVKNDLLKLENPQNPINFSEFFILRSFCYNLYSNMIKFQGKYFKIYLPFLQKDLLQQLILLKVDERVSANYQDYIISKNNPYLANLPYRNSGRKLKYIKLISNIITQNIFDRSLFKHPELIDFQKWFCKYHKDFFYSVFNYDNMLLSQLFNREKLKDIIKLFINNQYSLTSKEQILLKFSHRHFIYNLFNLELWLKDLYKK